MKPAVDLQLAREAIDAYGVAGMTSHHWLAHRTGGDWLLSGRHPFGPKAMCSALSGKYALDARGLRTCRVGVIDLDVGHDLEPVDVEVPMPPSPEGVNPLDWGYSNAGKTKRARQRARADVVSVQIARRARPYVEAIRRARPDLPLHVLRTPHGGHVVIVLDDVADVGTLRGALLRVVADAGLSGRREVEVFPSARGDLCRLPLTGASRLLADDLATARHHWRADDVRALLHGPRASLDGLVGVGGPLPRVLLERAPDNDLDPIVEAVGWELAYGDAFADQLADAYDCIPAGASYHCARKWVFALYIGCDLGAEETLDLLAVLLERPGHECEAAKTARGRSTLVRKMRSHLPHLDRGAAQGRLHPGRLRRDSTLTLVDELRRARDDRTRAARRRAAASRWEVRS